MITDVYIKIAELPGIPPGSVKLLFPSSHFVELPGIEPGSKQAAKRLSTCLAFSWFSNLCRQKATLQRSYSFWLSGSRQDSVCLILPFAMPWIGTPEGVASRRTISRLILVIKRLMRNRNCCHLCGASICFYGPCAQSPGMLTVPLSLLSKPVSPGVIFFCKDNAKFYTAEM